MGINFLEFNIVVLFLALILSLLYPFFLYRKEQKINKKLRITLAVIRGFVVFIISFFLLSPLINHRGISYEKPILIFAQDNSKSILLNNQKSYYENDYLKSREDFLSKLSDKFEVKEYLLEENAKPLTEINFKGKKSNLSSIFDEIKNNYKNRNLATLVLASDGIANTGRSFDELEQELQLPVYTVLMGDSTQKRDVGISDVVHNEIVYLKNDFLAEIRIKAYQLKNQTAKIKVYKENKLLFESSEQILSDNQNISVKARLNASESGVQKYTVRIEPIAKESNLQNNQTNFYVEVIENKQMIGIVAAAVHPDLAALKNAIESNENYKVDLLFANNINFSELKKYQMLILHQIPSSFAPASEIFKYIQQNNIPYWLIIGNQTYVDLLNRLNLGLRINNYKNNPNEVFPSINNEFQGFVLNEKWNTLSKELPPIYAAYGTVVLQNSFSKLFDQKIGSVKTDQALLAFQNSGVKSAYLFGEGIWKWRLIEQKIYGNSEQVDELCTKIIQYLGSKDDKRKFKVYIENKKPEESDDIIFIAELYNDSYEAVNSPDVNLKIKNSSNKIYPFVFNKVEKRYELNIGKLSEGAYSFEANTQLGQNKFSANGKFNVIKMNLEELNTVADFNKLRNLSELSGARAFKANELEALATELLNNSSFKTLTYDEFKSDELINLKWIFFLILVLISIEWFARKFNGLY